MGSLFHLDKNRVARSFGKAASLYDRYADLQRQVADHLLRGINPDTPETILDLGSGTGYCSVGLQDKYSRSRLLALDIAEKMLDYARQQDHGKTSYICADASFLPFTANSIDLLVSSLAIQWVRDIDRLFAEVHRVLKPGASAWMSTFIPGTLEELRRAWAEVDEYVHVNEFMSESAICNSILQNGLVCQNTEVLELQRHYENLETLTRELKSIGAHNMNSGQPRGLGGRKRLQQLRQAFEANNNGGRGIPVSWNILFLHVTK